MQDSELQSMVCEIMHADAVTKVEEIQSLWSGYGQIVRMWIQGRDEISSVIVKLISPPAENVTNARGWGGKQSHQRKLNSYRVERHWYSQWSSNCGENCRVPDCYGSTQQANHSVIVLEDLDASGFPERASTLSDIRLYACLHWLADFHATFLGRAPEGLWSQGTYWHLQTRPDEFAAMDDGPLKAAAHQIDQRLADCRFRTFVHGDAKVANFCFARSGGQVAAVDFQYVGGGCGMQDLAYFLGSCLSDSECERREEECLSVYFNRLCSRVDPAIRDELESEWRSLFPWAWADFHRFLAGWCATHPKLTPYSARMVARVVS